MAHTQYACRRRNTGTLRIAKPLNSKFSKVMNRTKEVIEEKEVTQKWLTKQL